ncbi:MAG: sigma 54-interacting transcriptional regulator [Acidobacteria bacterium]|nr:sigma 54-interacting transcriptional regulator [Acidobacteriota bacterium]
MAGEKKNKKSDHHIYTDAILDSISDGVFTVDREWIITSFNRAAERITGIPRDEAIGRLCSEVFRSSLCEGNCALRRTIKTDKPIIGKSCYIINPDGEKIPISVSTAVLRDRDGNITGGAETFRDLSEIEELRQELKDGFRVGDMSSRSPVMRKIFELIPLIAESSSTVLIQGESGTGKELIARAIHNLSSRRDKPFIAVNCGALPDALLESELFGHKAGAFTDAAKDKPGRFTMAKDGTILLDEIGTITNTMQVKLLRVLQEKSFDPLGSTKTELTNARIIAATNINLAEAVKDGSFREDLYYRINVIRIDMPPLRERKEDLPLLTEQFIYRFNNLQRKNIKGVQPEVMSLFMAYDWPGNIRELENTIERAFVLCNPDYIGFNDLPTELTRRIKQENRFDDIKVSKDLLEYNLILAALERNGFNRTAAARDLGIHKSTLYRKIERLGIQLPSEDGRGLKH